MDKSFCREIDAHSLVEQYVEGKLAGELREKFENHLKECKDHAQAVILERALSRGIKEFARSEIKSNLHRKIRKREDNRILVLRFAAILLVVIITPLLLYYQMDFKDPTPPLDETYHPGTKSIVIEGEEPSEIEPSEPKEEERFGISDKKPVRNQQEQQLQPPKIVPDEEISISAVDEILGGTDHTRASGEGKSTTSVSAMSDDQTLQSLELESIAAPSQSYQKAAAGRSRMAAVSLQEAVAELTVFSGDQQLPADSTAELKTEIDKHDAALRSCLQLYSKEEEYPFFSLEFTVFIDGTVGKPKIMDADFSQKELEKCLLEEVVNWNFKPQKNERVIRKRYQFSSD